MGSTDETAKTSPDASQDDEVYATDEEGDPGMVDRSRSEERLSAGNDSSRIVDPKVYGGLVLVGAVLLVFQQPTASGIGIGLIVIGAFIGAVDALSRF